MSAERPVDLSAGNQREQRSSKRRKQIRDRVALGTAGGLLVVATLVFLQARTDSGPAPTSAPQGQAQAPAQTESLQKGGTLEPDVRRVAARFLVTAVGRTKPDEAWALATPELRSGTTLAQWRTGELPVPPFPVGSLETTGFDVVESSKNKVLLQVLLVPKVDSVYAPTRYDMTIERTSATAPWKVSYCTPYAPPGMPADTE